MELATQHGEPDKPANADPAAVSAARHAPLSATAFVLILAGLMSINALATDIMLPGFPEISVALGGIEITRLQAVITTYMMGFGLSQMIMGFITDRYGRRPVLIGGLALYSLAAVMTAFSSDFATLLAFRFIQGFGAGAPRVIAQAAIRDCYDGRTMARIMSLVLTVFMAAPVLAPSIGEAIMLVSSWRWMLGSLAIFGTFLLVVSVFRFPETLPPERRRPIRLPVIREALVSVFVNRQTVGYTVAAGTFFGSLFGFIGSAQPVMVDVFGFGLWFPLVFAGLALTMSASSFINSALVEHFGMRLLSHGATVVYSLTSLVMLLLEFQGYLSAWLFIPLQAINMLVVGLVFSNFNALAMEPQGHIAGVSAAFVGAATVFIGAIIGYVIGDHYDGTVMPLVLGFTVCGFATLAILFVTEHGRLFKAHHVRRRV